MTKRKAGRGGQVVVFAATLPTIGVGALQPYVDETSQYGSDKERTLFEPREETWKDIGEQCASEGVGISMFLGMGRPIDIASIGEPARHHWASYMLTSLRSRLVAQRRGDVLLPQIRSRPRRHSPSLPVPTVSVADNSILLLNASAMFIRSVSHSHSPRPTLTKTCRSACRGAVRELLREPRGRFRVRHPRRRQSDLCFSRARAHAG